MSAKGLTTRVRDDQAEKAMWDRNIELLKKREEEDTKAWKFLGWCALAFIALLLYLQLTGYWGSGPTTFCGDLGTEDAAECQEGYDAGYIRGH